LAGESDPLSLTELERTVTVNGRSTESTFDADARQWTTTSPGIRGQ
jgi:hypothetical protein